MNDYKPLECFKAYDVRGKVPAQLDANLAYDIGRAVIDFLDAKTFVVGRDIRESGPDLMDALIKGITDAGADVFNIGLCGTEMVYFATSHLNADGGIMITASHNPPEYNGMKFVREGARPISSATGLIEISRLAELAQYQRSGEGKVEEIDVTNAYIESLLKYVNIDNLKPLKLVVNAGNGCAGAIVDELEKHLPFELIKVHHEPDSSFPNGVPNPLLEQNRAHTADVVKAHGADAGIAWDGDYDRCFFFDETGEFIEGYYIVGFLAHNLLQKQPGAKIIYDPRLTWNTIDLVKEAGGVPLQCQSGHAFIKEMMRQEEAIYGGEMSAHHYFKDFTYCDSGMIPWMLVTEIMCNTGKKLSDLVKERIEKYPVSGEINREVKDQDAVIEAVRQQFSPGAKIDTTDGISFEYDQWRFNLRKSNTEPILRLNIETRADKVLLQEKIDELLKVIES